MNEQGGTCSVSFFLSRRLSTHSRDWFEAPDRFSFSPLAAPINYCYRIGDEMDLCILTLICSLQ